MDIIIEVVLDIIFEGMMEATESKRVPLPVRILLIIILLAFFLGIFGILLAVGINEKSGLIIGISIIYLLAVIGAVAYKVCKYRRR